MKTFFYQPSNLIKGNTDTVQDEGGSVAGSCESIAHHGLNLNLGLQRTSSFRPDERTAGKANVSRPKLFVETNKISTNSPRNIHNASHMQKAAIMNTISRENSPSK